MFWKFTLVVRISLQITAIADVSNIYGVHNLRELRVLVYVVGLTDHV